MRGRASSRYELRAPGHWTLRSLRTAPVSQSRSILHRPGQWEGGERRNLDGCWWRVLTGSRYPGVTSQGPWAQARSPPHRVPGHKETSALLSSSPSSHTERGISRLEFLGKLSFDKTRLLAMPIRNVDKRLCLCQHVREKYTKIAATLTRSNETDDANHLTFMVGFYCHWMNINFSIIIWYFARIMITVTGSSKYRVVLYLLRLNDEVIVFVVEWV